MRIISRKAAKAAGLKQYYTGKPCKHGHIDKRSVACFGCMECLRQRANAWFRGLTGEKREARREYERQRWQQPDASDRARMYRQRYLEKVRQRTSDWKKANRRSCSDRENKRNALLRNQYVEDVSLDYLFARDRGICQLCGRKLSLATKRPNPRTPTRDHIIPLSLGGLHEAKNMQLACDICNIRKNNRVVGEQLRLL